MFFHHFREVATHTEFGDITVIEAYIDGSVIIRFHDKVGNYLLEIPADRFSQRSTRTGIQLGYLIKSFLESLFINVQFLYNLLPVFTGEFFIALSNDTFFQLQYRIGLLLFILLPANLYQQTFLKATGTDTSGIKILQDTECFFQFFFCRFDAGINRQFITDALQ